MLNTPATRLRPLAGCVLIYNTWSARYHDDDQNGALVDETLRFYDDAPRGYFEYFFNQTKTAVDGVCVEPLQQEGTFVHDLYSNYLEMLPVTCYTDGATCLNCSDSKPISGTPVFDADCESFTITFSGTSAPRQYFLVDSEPGK